MPLFSLEEDKLERINKIDFNLEKDIQNLTENNLNEIFSLEFVKTEFQLHDLKVDTLAFDNETKSFVIIEYKRNKNFSVIDQGYSYLALLLNNQADFILEYYQCTNKILQKRDVDWSQSKVIFVSPHFTKYQKYSINFKDLPIELWEVSNYGNNILFNQLKPSETNISIRTLNPKTKDPKIPGGIIKTYDESWHLKNASEEISDLYEDLRERILSLGDVDVKPLKVYIAFKASKNFVDMEFAKKSIRLWLNMKKGTLDDPNEIARDVSSIGHHGNGDYDINLTTDDDLDYLMYLISQSYNENS